MEARHGNVPAERKHGAGEQHQDAGDILRSTLSPSGLVVVRTHRAPSDREVEKDSDQSAQEDDYENEQRAGLPAALLIDRFEFVRKGLKEGILKIGFGIVCDRSA